MGQYLIDNNVISNYFSELFTDKGMAFVAEVIDQIPIISVITEIEALSWVNQDVQKEEIWSDDQHNIDDDMLLRLIKIRRHLWT